MVKGNKQPVRRLSKINEYRQRMHAIWRDKGLFNITEQKLMDQQSQIRKKQWLIKMVLEEIERRIEDEPHNHVSNDSESENEKWFLGFDEKDGYVFMKDVRVVVEHIGNRHENVEFGFRIKEELLEDEKEMLKSMSEILKLDRTRLLCLRKVEKRKLFTGVRKVNYLLKKIELNDMTEDNDLFYLGDTFVTKVFKKYKTKGEKKPSRWKRRLESQVKELKKDLGRLNALLESKKMEKRHQDSLQKRYKLNEKEKTLK